MSHVLLRPKRYDEAVASLNRYSVYLDNLRECFLHSGWRDRLEQLPLHVFGGELSAKELIRLLGIQHQTLAKWAEEEHRATASNGATETEAVKPKVAEPPVAPTPSMAMLYRIIAHQQISIEQWARDHRISRTVLFAWIAGGRNSVKGKVSEGKAREIDAAIKLDGEPPRIAPDEDGEHN